LATLLVIDDSARHRSEVTQLMAATESFDRVVEAADGILGLKLLLSESIDVVLCDLEMPGFDGEKLLHIKQASPASRPIPFLFLTASGDLDRRARLLELGACDIIAKPFHPPELKARLRMHLRTKQLHDELRLKTETMSRLSTTDAVTALRTRRYATEALSIEFLRAQRYGAPLSVLMADLDHFKSVNDDYGHLGGDAVLAGVSQVLLDEMRASDIAGRYGGEEILVILSQNCVEDAVVLAERWRAVVEASRFVSPDGREISVKISVGAAALVEGMKTPDDLIGAADEALYRAKAKGRNRVEFA